MKKIYKISIVSILLVLAFLTLNAAAALIHIPEICVCGCGCGGFYSGCSCAVTCLEECSCHSWNLISNHLYPL